MQCWAMHRGLTVVVGAVRIPCVCAVTPPQSVVPAVLPETAPLPAHQRAGSAEQKRQQHALDWRQTTVAWRVQRV
jgi:hypothetical protein